jgi:imidazole glycerol-phosphate synthase subunit HisH
MLAIIAGCGHNISSLQIALQRLGVDSEVTSDATRIQQADQVILPGVGQAATAMRQLHQFDLLEVLRNLQQPVLGICLGMQLLYQTLAEGDTAGLGIIAGKVTALPEVVEQPSLHMGWNTVNWLNPNSTSLLPQQLAAYYYFVHRYAAPVNSATVATATHGDAFSAIVKQRNFVGMQCHPEKSAVAGERLLQMFLQGDI